MNLLSIGNLMAGLTSMANKSGDAGSFWGMVIIEAICITIISAIVAAVFQLFSREKFVDVFKVVWVLIFAIDLIIWMITI
jgi:hypothetical protein